MTEFNPKKSLRQTLLSEREGLSPVLRREMSDEISRHLASWILSQDVDQVFSFTPHRGEPDFSSLWPLLPDGVMTGFPIVTGRGTMRFYAHREGDVLTANRYGILEPAPHQELLPSRKTLVLVPCVACDRKGFRLGYGGGFYDRYLAAHASLKTLGVVFQRFVLAELPNEAHDQPLGGVVTEEGVTLFSRHG